MQDSTRNDHAIQGKAEHAEPTTPESVLSSPQSSRHVTPTNPGPTQPRISCAKFKAKKRADGEDEKVSTSDREQTTVPVCKPAKQWWFRAHPDTEMSIEIDVLIVEGGDYDGTYFLAPDVEFPVELVEHIIPVLLTRCINSDRVEFFYLQKQTLKSPKASTRRCVREARHRWIKVRWNPTAKGYDYQVAKQLQKPPVWSVSSMDDLLEKAFGDNYIDRPDHPVINHLCFPDDSQAAD